MAHIAEKIDEKIDAGQRGKSAQRFAVADGESVHDDIGQQRQSRLPEEHRRPVFPGFPGFEGDIADDNQPHAEARQRAGNGDHAADGAVDAVFVGAQPSGKPQLPEEKRPFADQAGEDQSADVARGAPGITAGNAGDIGHLSNGLYQDGQPEFISKTIINTGLMED